LMLTQTVAFYVLPFLFTEFPLSMFVGPSL
jgi:hypothetical protein